jgi:uncharacterized protein
MKKILIPTLICFMMVASFQSCKHRVKEQKIKTDGPEVIEFKVLPFKLTDVKLLDGPFKHATDLNIESLLKYEPDKLISKFRKEAGLKPKAEHYHGWEDNTIAGHSLGHYLSACALMYQSTGDKRFLDRVNYMVDELKACQDADPTGYIGAFPNGKKILEEEVGRGNIRSAGFDLNGIWVPFYTEHKVMAGLDDAYHLCGNKIALEIETKFADWLFPVVSTLPDSLVQKMLRCEHGGINESMAELYGDTGNEKYLKLSRIFHHKAILDSLTHHKDILPGKHANTQIPKLVGLARRYELTADTSDRSAAEFFWDRVVHHHTYVTGGHCDHEYFGPADTLRNRLSNGTTETCNVYNMLKLSEHLFEWNAKPEVADFYERALFNHILSSQNPIDGRVIYNLSLEMGGCKEYQDPLWFTCCVGTGMENHSKYAREIYYHNNEALYVSQFIASTLNWEGKGLKVTQQTKYPEEQGTSLHFSCTKPVDLIVKIRYPYWANKGIEIHVNGKPFPVNEKTGSFVAIDRTWENGDKLEVKFPFNLRLENMPDDRNRIAVMYGPMVLAGDLGPEVDPNYADPLYVPVLMSEDRDPATWTEPVAGKTNTFKTKNIGRPRDIELRPFYEIHDRRYSVYFDLFNEKGWDKFQAEYKAKQEQQKKIERMTIDFFQVGEMQPERNHKFKSEKCWVNEFKNRKYREADRGGWFSFDMGVYAGEPMALVLEYWGGFPGSRTFDIFVNDTKFATENLSDAKPGEYFNKIYELPDKLTVGGGKINVKVVPHQGHRAGPVFSIRTMKR